MRLTTLQAAALGSATVLFAAPTATATHGHRHAHEQYGRRHSHNPRSGELVEKRSGCSLPDHPDLVFVPGDVNNGFAMSPDEPCTDGKYCPFACVPGKVMAQWEPNSTYVYPQSMNGGLYCNGGTAEKPFPNEPYCVDGTGAVQAVNKCGKVISFCQTVLPGNEAMIIPTDVKLAATIAVPGIKYWDKTAAHYYINPPGVSASEGCVWGDDSKPVGNWSPYVAGANTVENGETFVKIAWNPIFTGCDLSKTKPSYGVKIECPQGGCNGLPCSIDPSKNGVGGVDSPVSTVGVGGASFCVVTVPKGQIANIIVFNTDGSTGTVESSAAPPPPKPTTTSTTAAPPKSTTSSTPTTSAEKEAISSAAYSSESPVSSSTTSDGNPFGGIFHENGTHTMDSETRSSHSTTVAPPLSTTADIVDPVSTTSKNEGVAPDQGGTAIAGLIVALVAAAALY
ncbi:hypothetical protein B0H66DRAFT_247119 [Apodospora peruviana]|uniref:Uncharacterized protein n=1 Tax=Apodospora peruviana TaxID=516989 RepID=A0AAE0M5J6_9PEZI|nr:hypothetical protein B0H66DRAFT_247119 [Apodospora peruviana]